MNLQKVSIIIVNYNGKHHLSECFNSIAKLNYPQDKIEVIVVDNGSTDGSIELIKQKFRWVKLLRNSKNEGFAKPCNDGAHAAAGDYLAFINNDMRLQKDWLIELINSMQNSGAKCAGSVILNWNGKYLDFAGGGINFQGYGFQDDFKRPMSEMEPLLTEDKDILFACGGSMIVEKDLFLFAGGFDQDYFAYYEDVDLGWRLRVLGCKIVLSVKSRVYHKHNSTSKTITKERIQYLFERNKLYTCYKNYGDELFYKVFFPSLLLEIRETYLESDIDGYNYNIKNEGAFDSEPVKIGHMAAMKLSALNEFVENIGRTEKKRAFIQANRKTSDEEIKPLLTNPFIIFLKDTAEFLNTEYDIVKALKLDKAFNTELKCRVMLISTDSVGESMAEAGIRYWEIAKALAVTGRFTVTLACPDYCNLSCEGVNILTYSRSDPESLMKPVLEANVVMLKGSTLEDMPKLKGIVSKKYVIIDCYETALIDSMERFKGDDLAVKNYHHSQTLEAINYQLQIGDFFICANEKQRDNWLGMLMNSGKITPALYTDDPSCRKLVDIVPAFCNYGENADKLAKNESAGIIVKPVIDFCDEPVHYTSHEETQNNKLLSAVPNTYEENSDHRGSLQERLENIEKQQLEIARLLKYDSRLIKETHGRTKEIQKWSDLMESRFVKLKSKLGRIKFLKRFVN